MKKINCQHSEHLVFAHYLNNNLEHQYLRQTTCFPPSWTVMFSDQLLFWICR